MWKTIRKNYRRLIASLLTMALVITNAGGNLGTIFAAGETENALFLLEGRELREAIQEAREQGEVFDFSTLRLAAKRKSIKTRYEKLLLWIWRSTIAMRRKEPSCRSTIMQERRM